MVRFISATHGLFWATPNASCSGTDSLVDPAHASFDMGCQIIGLEAPECLGSVDVLASTAQ
ncbi:hypothetical protein CFIMG_000649RA [Ceratocystis fimbriata CBS 114723]|uniref:Uncharacterized protein n=1 Tax=Ceratocystis fimbriata CBS 114723 TaxID=1035309 RepID=A0A2C5X3H0_9PEZI|nr:hypothetical protein CFIMG_000649RA [Ceratocystis fimbriata CBS 114723]